MKTPGLLAAALAGAIAAGAAMLPPSPVNAAPERGGRHCFWIRSVDGFRSIDNRTVYVLVNQRDVYELKLFTPCLDVDWLHHVALRKRGAGNICEGQATNLEIYARSPANRQRCPVSSVRHLTPSEVRALPAAARP